MWTRVLHGSVPGWWSGYAVSLAHHEGSLALPPFVLLLPQPDPPAHGTRSQEAQSSGQQHQSQHWDGGPVWVKGVCYHCHHNASNEDDHSKRHSTAVAGHLSAAGGRRQLDLVDMWDMSCYNDPVVLPGLVPAQLLCRDWCRHLHGTSGYPRSAFTVEVVRHGDLTGKEEVGHLDTDVSSEPVTEQLAENRVKGQLRILCPCFGLNDTRLKRNYFWRGYWD